MNETGAKPGAIEAVKPNESEPPDLCPCPQFLKCTLRMPYGESVWSNPKKRKMAMGLIAYSQKGAITDGEALKRMGEKFAKRNERNRKRYKKFNEFFANLYPLVESGQEGRVLTMPEITDGEITLQMDALKSAELYNTAGFTNFQRSIFLRTNLVKNLVKNRLTMRSDLYREGNTTKYQSTEMIPYSGEFSRKQWSVDHIQTRAKGGCNRFCNGAFLSIENNMDKKDNWPGCPCADCEQKTGGQTEFTPPGSKRRRLFECQYLYRANQDKRGRRLPLHPPGMMKEYKEICGLDDPRDFAGRLKRNVAEEINKIRQ